MFADKCRPRKSNTPFSYNVKKSLYDTYYQYTFTFYKCLVFPVCSRFHLVKYKNFIQFYITAL